MKRLGVLIIFLLTTVQLFAQTQYDYYEGRDAYGGVDTAINGLKVFGIIVLVVIAVVIVGGIWAKTMDFFKQPKDSPPQHDFPHKDTKTKEQHLRAINKAVSEAPEHYVVITIEGKIVEADVTRTDGTREREWFWCEIDSIMVNLKYNVTLTIGNDIVKPAGSTYRGMCVEKDDIRYQTIENFKKHNQLKIRGTFNPKKLQLLRVDGYNLYDEFVYYYDGKAVKQSIITDKEAETIANA